MPLLLLSARWSVAKHYDASGGSGKLHRVSPPHPEVGWVNVLAERQGLQHVLQWQRDIQRPPQREAGGGAELGAAAASAEAKPPQLERQRPGISSLCGLVRVRAGQTACGALTRWTAEEDYLRRLLFDDSSSWQSMCSLEVESLLAFDREYASHSPTRFASELWEPEKIEFADFCRRSGASCLGLRTKLAQAQTKLRTSCGGLSL